MQVTMVSTLSIACWLSETKTSARKETQKVLFCAAPAKFVSGKLKETICRHWVARCPDKSVGEIPGELSPLQSTVAKDSKKLFAFIAVNKNF